MQKKEIDTTTLQGIGELAKQDYGEHRRYAMKAAYFWNPKYKHFAAPEEQTNPQYIPVPLGAAALAGVEALGPFGTPGRERGETSRDKDMRVIQGRAKGNLERATEHYRQNRDEYRELALIDAHLEGKGKDINVEQPLEIGRRVEVPISNDDPGNIIQ